MKRIYWIYGLTIFLPLAVLAYSLLSTYFNQSQFALCWSVYGLEYSPMTNQKDVDDCSEIFNSNKIHFFRTEDSSSLRYTIHPVITILSKMKFVGVDTLQAKNVFESINTSMLRPKNFPNSFDEWYSQLPKMNN